MHNLLKTYTKLSYISSEPSIALKCIKFLSEGVDLSILINSANILEHAITFLAPTNHETLFSQRLRLFKGHLTRTHRHAIAIITVIVMGSV